MRLKYWTILLFKYTNVTPYLEIIVHCIIATEKNVLVSILDNQLQQLATLSAVILYTTLFSLSQNIGKLITTKW